MILVQWFGEKFSTLHISSVYERLKTPVRYTLSNEVVLNGVYP